MMGINHVSFKDLSSEQQDLVLAAQKIMSKAYNLYSSYFVGAAVQTKKGEVYAAANMENSSYGLSICAEPGAIQHAISAGDPEITSIAVCGGFHNAVESITPTPCGRCRQLIFESSQISSTDIEVICANSDLSSIIIAKISDLLPLPFGPKNLGLDKKIEELINRIKDEH